jgi:hypothetical protein
MSLRRFALAGLIAVVTFGLPPAGRAERLRLVAEGATDGKLRVGVKQPFEVFLVAERDSTHRQVSAVAYTLAVPEGMVLLGEELLVESLVGLGTSRGGMNLVFRCVDAPKVRVLRFRLAPTRPLQNVSVALRPDTRTNFLGVVGCQDEQFAKFDSVPDSVQVSTR